MWYNDIRFVGCYQVLVKKKGQNEEKKIFHDLEIYI